MMGCNNSVPDPNLMYGIKSDSNHNKQISQNKNKIHPHDNSLARNGQTQNGNIVKDEHHESGQNKHNKDLKNKQMRGDLISFTGARVSRQKSLLRHNEKREKLAQEISAKAMDDKERFSLSTTRSRTTSRAASPRVSRSTTMGHTTQSVISTGNTTMDSAVEETPSCSSPNKHGSSDNLQESPSKALVTNISPTLSHQESNTRIHEHGPVSSIRNGKTLDHVNLKSSSNQEESTRDSVNCDQNSNSNLPDMDIDVSGKSKPNSSSALENNPKENIFKKDKIRYHKKKSKKQTKASESVLAGRDVVSHG